MNGNFIIIIVIYRHFYRCHCRYRYAIVSYLSLMLSTSLPLITVILVLLLILIVAIAIAVAIVSTIVIAILIIIIIVMLIVILIVIILKEKPSMIEESVALMDKLGTALLSTKVVGESEPTVFKTEELSMVLDRQTLSVLARKRLQGKDGRSGISFPSRKVLIKNVPVPVHSLDVQVNDQWYHL